MADSPVTDPALLAQLEGGGGGQAVSDPKLLQQLETDGSPQEDPNPNALGPWASAVVRPIAEGAAALPGMAANAGVAAGNLVNQGLSKLGVKTYPEHQLDMPGKAFQDALDKYTQKPSGWLGKGAEAVSSMIMGGMSPNGIGLKAADEAAGAMAGTGRAAAVREAQQAGFKMPPEDAIGANLASISVKAKLERQLSARNSERVEDLTKLALGFPENHPLSVPALEQVRDVASKPYDVLGSTGDVKADEEFMNDVATSGSAFSKVDRSFPKEPGEGPPPGGPDASKIAALKGRYFQPQFTAREAIDAMRQLRKDSSSNLKVYDPEKNAMGLVQRQIADAFEARLERHAEQLGKPQLVQQLRAARVKIAQTYAVQDAMNPSTGSISALALARLYQNGAPLTGELQTIARAALTSPKAFKDADKLGKEGEFSVVDFLVAAGAYLHNPSLAAAVVARPAIRKYLESQIGQRMSRPSIAGQVTQQAVPGMVPPAMQQGPQTLQ